MQNNPRLNEDSRLITKLELSELRMITDGDVPWFLLVPQVEGVVELIDLDDNSQLQLLKEINMVSNKLKSIGNVDKINIATIGNIVSQLHIHIIGRYNNDRAWPGTIWGTQKTKDLTDEEFNKWRAVTCN